MMEWIAFEKRGRIGILKINRPDALNALNPDLLAEWDEFLATGIRSEDVRVLIVTGEGRAFIAGADIKRMMAFGTDEARAFCELGHRVADRLESAEMITIAAVNGFALGGGLEFALACDFIIASSRAKLGLPEVTLGVIPGFGGTQRLARAVGSRLAKELIATGRFVEADEALRIGLVNRVTEPEKLLDEAVATAERILKNSHAAVTRAKRAVNEGIERPLDGALARERDLFVDCFTTGDPAEGMEAFVEKRHPDFA